MTATANLDPTDRNDAIKLIRAALKTRSGKTWSITGGLGTSYGWIQIHVPPARRDEYDRMSKAEAAELGRLLGLDGPVHRQGEQVPAGSVYRREYVDRAEGRTPSVTGTPYWD